MKLWEAMVKNLPPKNAEKMPDDPKKWISDYYPSKRGDKSIFKRMCRLTFEEEKSNNNHTSSDSRKTYLSEKQKHLDMLTAQLECIQFLLTKGNFTYKELTQAIIDESILMHNIRAFTEEVIV